MVDTSGYQALACHLVFFVENRSNELSTFHQLVDEFHTSFTEKVHSLELKHKAELFRLSSAKKQYKVMVTSHGKETIERQLIVSEMQARRHAQMRGGVFVEAHNQHKHTNFQEEYRRRQRIDSTMLY